MSWLQNLQSTQPVAHAIGMIAFVCVLGMAFGSIKFRGIGLGTSGVLFAGILVGHFFIPADSRTLAFLKEFGLILFVFTIGLQLGPGFFSALKNQGIAMNGLAACVVLMGVLLATAIGLFAGFDPAAILGIFSGASTNTPSLGAATQTLSALPQISSERLTLPALAYAVTYPAAILGLIVSILLLKRLFKIDPAQEAAVLQAAQKHVADPLERRTLVVANPNLSGVAIANIPGMIEAGVAISRLRHGAETLVASASMRLSEGDRLLAVGPRSGLDHLERSVGGRTDEDLISTSSGLTSKQVVVTDRGVLGQNIDELKLDQRFGVAITRVSRADIEMTAVPGVALQYGDMVQLVGAPQDLEQAAAALGNSVKELSETQFIPFFLGLLLGVLLGTIPIPLPGLPHPILLGLAGGPLVVALLLGRIGRIRKQVWHMPANTNLAFREFGIAIFFAAVGLSAGPAFFSTVFSRTGLLWLLSGLCVTIIPILVVGIYARVVLKMNFLHLAGLLSGSMTDPPALAFSSNLLRSETPILTYATVFPLTTLLRILAAQVLAILLFR